MADNGIFCDQAAMLRKAGKNVDPALNAATDTTFVFSNDFISQAESEINSATRFNWSDAFAGLDVDVKAILTGAASARAGMFCVNWNNGSYGSRQAETILDVLNDQYKTAIKELKEVLVRKFVEDA